MTCDDYRAAYLAGELSDQHRGHRDSCSRCRAEEPTLTTMMDALSDPALWAEPAPGMAARVAEGIGAGRAGPDADRRRRIWPLWVAGVAVVALVATLLTVTLRSDRPDWEVAISGVGGVPGGTVLGWNEPAGTRVAFDVPGFPPAPEGEVYELWFSRGRVHVSGGTFTNAAEAELLVGVARSAYPRIWVTREPLDDDTSPSRVVVLDTKPRS